MVVNDKKFIYASSLVAHTKKGYLNGWFTDCMLLVDQYIFDQIDDINDHSMLELNKLSLYDSITDKIINDILLNIDPINDTLVGIEGYSYSSSAGPLIDLVTFSTLLRIKIKNKLPSLSFVIYQPTEIKKLAAKLTYPPIKKGKKIEYRNNDGIAGGAFKKQNSASFLSAYL
jgi:hypothetical protein